MRPSRFAAAPLAYSAIAVGLAAITAIGFTPTSVIAGIPLTLVVPGFAIAGAMFSQRALRFEEEAMLAGALSLGSLILCGLFLSISHIGISRGGVAVWSAVVVAGAAAVVLARSRRYPSVTVEPATAAPASVSGRQWGLLAAAVAIALVAGGISVASEVARAGRTHFTALSLNYPAIDPAVHAGLQVLVTNHEGATKTYDLQMIDSSGSIRLDDELTIASGASKTIGDPTWSGAPVTVNLYLSSDRSTVYRTVRVAGPTPAQ